MLIGGTLGTTQLELCTFTLHAWVLEVDSLPETVMCVLIHCDVLVGSQVEHAFAVVAHTVVCHTCALARITQPCVDVAPSGACAEAVTRLCR